MELQNIKKDECDITSDHFLKMGGGWCCRTTTISLIGSWFRCKTSVLSVNEVSCPLSVKKGKSSCASVHRHWLFLWLTLRRWKRVRAENREQARKVCYKCIFKVKWSWINTAFCNVSRTHVNSIFIWDFADTGWTKFNILIFPKGCFYT